MRRHAKVNLRLDVREDAVRSAIVPGDGAGSMLIDRVAGGLAHAAGFPWGGADRTRDWHP